MLTLLIVIIVVLALGGGVGYWRNPGFVSGPIGWGGGGVGLVLIILIIPVLAGRF